MGTPAYMAPEQITGEAVDARADVYSAGCVLYELLAGRPPFTGASTAEVLRRSLTEVPRPIEELRDDVPAPWPASSRVPSPAIPTSAPPTGARSPPRCGARRCRLPSRAVRRRLRRPSPPRVRAAALLAGVGLAGLAWLLLERSTGPALAFKERDFVLVADVVNATGEPVFDLALKSALETDLRQSRYVNVLDAARCRPRCS